MTPARLEELRGLCSAAAPAPWRSLSYGGETGHVPEIYTICTGDDGDRDNAMSKETADFIAAARAAVPELIAEVERLRGLVGLAAQGGACKHGNCPWCGADSYIEGHSDCPAFTPEGKVK